MHSQTGYQYTRIPKPGNMYTHVAILHGKLLAALDVRGTLYVQHQGWITRATCRAINGFLADCGRAERCMLRDAKGTPSLILVDAEGREQRVIQSCL